MPPNRIIVVMRSCISLGNPVCMAMASLSKIVNYIHATSCTIILM